MSKDQNACMCGDATVAHLDAGGHMSNCSKCACTAYVQFQSTPEQDQQDEIMVRLVKAEEKAKS